MDHVGSKLRVLYDFEYETRDKRRISITKGEKLFLICKTNNDWWQVIKNSSERPFFVPAPYVIEAGNSNVLYAEGDCFDNLLYATPPDFGSLCDCKHTTHSTGYPNDFSIMHSEEQDSKKVLQNYSLSVKSENDIHGSKVGEHEASSSCESGTGNVLSECIGLTDGIGGEEGNKYMCAETQHSAHTYPRGENKTFEEGTYVSVPKVSLPCNDRERLKTDMIDSSSGSIVNKDMSSVMSNAKVKNKLSKSRSFKTKNELQKISRLDPSSVVLLPLENPIVDKSHFLETVSSTNYKRSDRTCDANKEKVNKLENPKSNSQTTPVPLVFHNELYHLSNNQDIEANKTMDSGNISSESLFTHEEDISDSGASHKSGVVSSAQSRESIQEHSDLLADDTSKEELASSGEEIWTTECYEDVPIPQGWRLDYDEESGEQCYINDVTHAKWFSSTDGKGRVYFFEENSSVSSWTLPNIVVANEEAAAESDPQLESSNLPLRNQDGEKKSRIGKARSLFLNDQKHKEATSKSSSIPRNWLQLYDLDKDVLKYGYMNRTKITENGKKMSKKWASAYVVLTEDALCFYKDLNNSQHSVGLQPELSMQLSGARMESGDKLSSRKHIFLITSGSLQLLCECKSAELAAQWRAAISNAIARLNKPVVTPTIKISHDKPKTASIGRSKSLQVKNREGTFDDGVTTEEQQMKIRDRLKKFFNRRPTREILASKGIYKDEPVFDSHLEKVCPSHPPFIPDFVKLCVAAIESKEENMKTDGLYRASGNLSHVQKIRLQVDQNNLTVLELEEDVHVLTGALKLFFRELKEPLIPYELFNEAIDAGGMNASKKEKTKMFRDIVKKLPPPNHDTLKFLLQHLRRVTAFEEHNRMHVPNLAIVFGPTLMWREKEYHQNMAIEYMQQNLVIEFLLQQFDEIFR